MSIKKAKELNEILKDINGVSVGDVGDIYYIYSETKKIERLALNRFATIYQDTLNKRLPTPWWFGRTIFKVIGKIRPAK